MPDSQHLPPSRMDTATLRRVAGFVLAALLPILIDGPAGWSRVSWTTVVSVAAMIILVAVQVQSWRERSSHRR